MAETKSKTGLGHARAGIALAFVVALGVAAPAMADPPVPPGETAKSAPTERAKSVLAAHCRECRERYGEGSALDLAALADDPGLIAPRHPDASPAYQRLFAPPRKGEGDDAEAAPSPAEIESVRDWIEGLPARDDGCRSRTPIAADGVKALVRQWRELVGDAEASGTRFVSLAHLWNACVSAEKLMELRVATATLLAVLTRRREGLRLETLGEESALLAIRPGEEALVASGWDSLTADAPLLAYGAVPADWLAARILSRPTEAVGAADPVANVRFDGVAQRAVSMLARFWTRDVDLVRAASERGVTPRDLKETLSGADGDLLVPARRLAYGALPRAPWQRLSAALDGGAATGIEAAMPDDEKSAALDVVLWPDAPFYRPRDLVTFNVRVGRACHLTLIGVDGDGQAIVLFPNELEPDNLVAPAVTVKVPGHDGGYQFRFDKAGEETVVAICQRHARRLEGIDYDHERQRFAILGDWRTFLRTAPELEKEIRKKAEAEAARRKRRRRPPLEPEPPPVDPEGPPMEGRAAIAVTVDLGGRAR